MKALKFAIIGSRGIPASYGGFETFAEEVAIRLVQNGVETMVIGDKSQQYDLPEYRGVEILKTQSSKPSNPLKFYKESLQLAVDHGANFILMCGVGGTMWIPFFRNKGAIIAVNPDGLGFKRDKYVWWKKAMFYTQYLVAAKIPEYLVCDSKGIETYYKKHFGRKKETVVIEYGTYINPFLEKKISEADFVNYDLPYSPLQYHLIVARLEPENNVEMILKGYAQTKRIFPLVVVGNLNTPHSEELQRYQNDQIHFIGGIYDREKLQLLRAGSLSYWHGHSVGGTNPSLLEAMGSANLCVCHDNIFNREVIGESGFYFSDDKKAAIIFDKLKQGKGNREVFTFNVLDRAKKYYSWELITEKYRNFAAQTLKNK